MLEFFLNLDRELLVYLNNLGSNNWDMLWLMLTDKLTFIPFFILVIYFIFKKFSLRQALFILLFISLLILFTDQFTNLVKDYFQAIITSLHSNVVTTFSISSHSLNKIS